MMYHLTVKAKRDDNIHADNTAKQNLMKTVLQIILQLVNTVKMSGPPTPLEFSIHSCTGSLSGF